MDSNTNVIVLLPNGRRQTVKVTMNTTLLQVLDEVCQKYGYEAKRYDIKHFNRVLDINGIFRFTGLSNNAQLEMIPCTKEREISNVTIGIQTENGQRSMGEFSSNAALSEILSSLCSITSIDTAVLVYMHREISGKEELEKTTLRSLGLTRGRAMLRLLHRDPNQKKEQAHVYIPKTTKSLSESNKNSSFSISKFISNEILDPIISIDKTGKQKKRNGIRSLLEKKIQADDGAYFENKKEYDEKSNVIAEQAQNCSQEEVKIQYLGKRKALLFNQVGAATMSREEPPDSFFDLTLEDAKLMLRSARKNTKSLDESPFVTDSQRQCENDRKIFNQLKKYQRAIIRIQFPDQIVLQGLFEPLENVKSIKDFVGEHLEDPEGDFVLYTTPPRKDLNPNRRLIDENLVPSAVIYYLGPSPLKPELLGNLTDPAIATIAASNFWNSCNGTNQKESNDILVLNAENKTEKTITTDPVPGTSELRDPDSRKTQTAKWLQGLFK